MLNTETRTKLLQRIQQLNSNSLPKWGRMTVYQMIRHCLLAEHMFQGKKQYKQVLMGRLFGKMALKSILKEGALMPRNAKASDDFLEPQTTGDVETAKQEWVTAINGWEQSASAEITHWFFGRMTKEQAGQFVYKHTDHHLRQFNC